VQVRKAAKFALGFACLVFTAPLRSYGAQTAPSAVMANANRSSYVGDEACRTCHVQKVESYYRTAHHLTSRMSSKDSVLGSFAEGKNLLKTSDPGFYFRMESKPKGLFQTSMEGFPTATSIRSERFDIVIGSGKIGQTYLYWNGDRLFELPVSYWAALGSWISSPGYLDEVGDFDRPVTPRCLECHLAYAETVPGPEPLNRYNAASMVTGISCERCHGPGRQHLEAETKVKTLESITNPTRLSRDRQVEVCAQCHNGLREPVAPAFSYLPGELLDNYFKRDLPDPKPTAEVHGNQVGLLQRSRCYESSVAMNCSTCHDVHQTQRNVASYSEHCLACHPVTSCGKFRTLGVKITRNCIDCHMPVQSSDKIISVSNGREVKAQVRTHWIKVYPEKRTP